MLAQDYMIYIMEEIRMWNINKEDSFEIWTSNICRLEIEYINGKCRILVDYKGYNIVFAMGMWGFEEEIQIRRISYDIEGEKGKFKTFRYVVNEEELNLFCDLIYFFLAENKIDGALNDAYKL